MGSKVYTTSIATDNRLAVTDNAFGLSSSGSGNQLALAGHIINASAGVSSASGKGSAAGGSTQGGQVNISLLDGGSINRSFDFANNALSEMLSAIILGQKQAQAAQNYQADTIGAAMSQSATTQAAAAAATAAAEAELQKNNQGWLKDFGKELLVGVAVAGIGWYVWKGRK